MNLHQILKKILHNYQVFGDVSSLDSVEFEYISIDSINLLIYLTDLFEIS
jgi:hypothetical protein